MQSFALPQREQTLRSAALWLGTALALVSLGLFAYLGTFTRYIADDYCDSSQVVGVPVIPAVLTRYLTAGYRSSDRYSNLMYVALTEFVFPGNVQILPVMMLTLWTAGLTWVVHGARRLAGLAWPLVVDFFLGCLLAYFPVLEAPNRFQSIYWRASVASHFAPLVYLAGFTGLLLLLIRRTEARRPAVWLGALCLVLAFFGGGFSEPPDAVLVVASLLALLAVWALVRGPRRTGALHLLSWTLAGGLLALVVMALSPANSRLETSHSLGPFLYRTAVYPLQFMRDSITTLPLPTLASILLPAVVLYLLFACEPRLPVQQQRLIGLLMALTLVVMYGLVAASFAPSVYGPGYPSERARFAGLLMMATAALAEGACLGVLAAQWQPLHAQAWLVGLASVALVILALYPLRAAGNILNENLSSSMKWSAAWDARLAQIYRQKAEGVENIVVRQLPGVSGVKELDTRPNFWVNRCAAAFYGVQSISAPQTDSLH